jgi:hypothetical protein
MHIVYGDYTVFMVNLRGKGRPNRAQIQQEARDYVQPKRAFRLLARPSGGDTDPEKQIGGEELKNIMIFLSLLVDIGLGGDQEL